MATFNASALLAGNSAAITRATTLSNFWLDTHTQWPGAGPSAPPFPTPPDSTPPAPPLWATAGVSAPPPFAGASPAIDPTVGALNAALVARWGVPPV